MKLDTLYKIINASITMRLYINTDFKLDSTHFLRYILITFQYIRSVKKIIKVKYILDFKDFSYIPFVY